MSKTVLVRYQTRAETAEENQRLVEEVFDQLASDGPDGLRYATFRLADGVTFLHVAVFDGAEDALSDSAAFQRFQNGIGDRLAGPPQVSEATVIGSYGFPLT
ncbi:hypothetical protein [Saccharopolyspora sp. 5N708]|uniref:hypothetical protein n=1 Tax=Saccharopolyspora sp. 5N708 TaxID=3457424 RepID=UPI003FD30FF8